MFLEIEGEIWINLELVEKIEMRKRPAILWIGGAPVESYLAYDHLIGRRKDPELIIQPAA
jgi:hypothetical protein